jgi:hypothetical protein
MVKANRRGSKANTYIGRGTLLSTAVEGATIEEV